MNSFILLYTTISRVICTMGSLGVAYFNYSQLQCNYTITLYLQLDYNYNYVIVIGPKFVTDTSPDGDACVDSILPLVSCIPTVQLPEASLSFAE